MLIDTGFLGAGALIALFATGAVVAVRQRRPPGDDEMRSLALSLAASVSAAAVSFFFFDAFSFPMLAGVTFLVLGLIGALHSLGRPATSTVGRHENSATAPRR